MDALDRLRLLALNDTCVAVEPSAPPLTVAVLGPREQSLVRLAALVGVGGNSAVYGPIVDECLGAGATNEELVDAIVALSSIVGLPRVVAAASKVAAAIGHDLDEALEQHGDV